jgi:hypothetical protein
MRAKSSRRDRDRFAKWLAGWETEAERLAAFHRRTIEGTNEHEQELTAAIAFRKLAALVNQTAHALQALVHKDTDPLIRVFLLRMSRLEREAKLRISMDQAFAYRAEIEKIAALNANIAADFEQAAESLHAHRQPDRGNQSTLALRLTIYAAASSYFKLFGKQPGRSRSDYGTFGKFVLEIIARVPAMCRPVHPSPSAISDVVKQWARRHPVAR